MSNQILIVKEKLNASINQICDASRQFVKSPSRDYTRVPSLSAFYAISVRQVRVLSIEDLLTSISGFLQIPPHDGHPCLWLTVSVKSGSVLTVKNPQTAKTELAACG